jgi:serine/threonine-protein kinase
VGAVTDLARRRGVTTQIFVASVVVVAAALGVVFALTVTRARRVAERAIELELSTTRSAVDDALSQRTVAMQRLAAGLVAVPTYFSRFEAALQRGDQATLLDQADEFRGQLGANWTLMTDGRGRVAAWTMHPDRIGEPLGGGALVDRALAGDTTSGAWIEPFADGDTLYQAVAVPFRAPGGGPVQGILIGAVLYDSALAGALRRHTGSEIVIASRDTYGKLHLASTTLDTGSHAAVLAALAGSRGGEALRVALADGEWIGARRPLLTAGGDTIGELIGLRSRTQALAAIDSLRTSILVSFALGLLLALVVSVISARRIAAPIRELVAATRGAREGRFELVLPDRGPREIGELSQGFRALIDDLRAQQDLVQMLQKERTALLQPPGELQPGSVFGERYEVLSLLGSGGMGEVYRALDRELNEPVALKTLRADLMNDDATLLERFREEIRLARRITHRNVVRTHDLGVLSGIYYLTMEWIDGKSVADLLRTEGRLPLGVVQTIGTQLCRALSAAHEVGVVHRDIKPPNLLLDRSGVLKVTDFGIARLLDSASDAARKLTGTGMVVGTADYMAPEQLGGDVVDARADLYAAGAVLYECLTGASPHAGIPLHELMMRSMRGDAAPDPREKRTDLPAPLAAVVMRALAGRPDDRWPTARAMLRELDKAA